MITYSDFSAGSDPSNRPTTLVDSIGLALQRRVRLQRAGQREPRQRLVVGDELIDLVERVAAAGEHGRGAARGQRDRQRLAGGVVQLAIEQRDRGLRRAAAAPAPALCRARPARRGGTGPARRRARSRRGAAAPAIRRAAGARGAAIVATPIAPGALQRQPPLVGGVHVRLHVVGHLHRRERVDVDRDLALADPRPRSRPSPPRGSTGRSRRTPSALRSIRRARRAR